MSLLFQVDLLQFEKALKALAAHSNKAFKDLTNQHAYYTARRAMQYTPKANPAKIARQHGIVRYKVDFRKSKSKKTGAVSMVQRNTAVFGGDPQLWLYKLINSRRGSKGKPGLRGSAMTRAVQGFVKRRQRASGTLRSGFIQMLKDLAPYTSRGVPSYEPGLPKVKAKGWGQHAKGGLYIPQATMAYSVNAKLGKVPIGTYPEVKAAWLRAIREETVEMVNHTKQKILEAAQKASHGI